MQFAQRLATLPSIDHIAALKLYNGDALVAEIFNQPGSAGSVRIYNALAQQYGEINKDAANTGLEWYAEHTEDARQFSGKHPNIDRLFFISSGTLQSLRTEIIQR